jgi:hypothetical protein
MVYSSAGAMKSLLRSCGIVDVELMNGWEVVPTVADVRKFGMMIAREYMLIPIPTTIVMTRKTDANTRKRENLFLFPVCGARWAKLSQTRRDAVPRANYTFDETPILSPNSKKSPFLRSVNSDVLDRE